jgi:predicted permease
LKFSELWRLSSIMYKEISFQSIFSLRAGGALPRRGKDDVRTLINNAEVNTILSKLVTTVFIALFGFAVFLPLMSGTSSTGSLKDLTAVGSVSTFLAVVLFLISFMGLQVSTSFISSKATDVLRPLSLSRSDISRIVFLCFLRIFDIPLVASVTVLLLAYYFVGGSVLGGLVAFTGVIVTEVFALTLTMGLARFFYSRVAGGGGKSRWKTLLRFAFMLVWILPSFAIYFVVNFAEQIVQSFASLTQGFSSVLQLFVMIYPFSYGYLVSFVTFSHNIDYLTVALSVVACLGYVALAAYCVRWVTRTVGRIGAAGVSTAPREAVKDTIVSPQVPWLGTIRKDLRVASRSPSYASLFLLPAIEAAVLAMSFSSFSEVGLSSTLGLLTGMSVVVLMLPPMLVSIEGLAASYMRSLPLKKKTLISAKTLLSTFTYAVSLAVLFIVALFMGKSYSYILTFGAIHLFSVAAATMLELIILANKFWKEGFAIGNIYARLSTYILIIIPGLAVVMIPIIAALATFIFAQSLTLVVFLGIAATEFAVTTAYVALEK